MPEPAWGRVHWDRAGHSREASRWPGQEEEHGGDVWGWPGDGRGAAGAQGVPFAFVQKSYTQNSTLPNQKNNIYIIYIYLTNVKEKSRLCKSPLCLLVLRGHGERAAGGGLYLDVSMFSSLKLLQCSITLRAISLVSCRAVAILIMSFRRGIPPSLISRGQYLSG